MFVQSFYIYDSVLVILVFVLQLTARLFHLLDIFW
jgi:hypothetical protein